MTATASHSFFRLAISSAAANALAMAISMIGSILLTRALGPDGRGAIAWISSLTLIASAAVQCGLGQFNRRYAGNNTDKTTSLLWFNLMLPGIACLIALPLCFAYALPNPIAQDYQWMVIIGLASVPVIAIATNLSEMLLGLHYGRAFNVILIIQKTAYSAMIALFIWLELITPTTGVAILGLSFTFYLLMAITTMIRRRPKEQGTGFGWIMQHLKSYVLTNYMSNMLLVASNNVIAILLAQLHSLKAAGYFAACMIVIGACRTSIRMVAMHAIPRISAMNDWPSKRKTMLHSALISLLLSGSIALAIALTSSWFVPLLFGTEFTEAVSVMNMTALAMIPAALFINIQASVAAIGKGFAITLPALVLLVSLIICSLLIIPTHGAIGGAYSSAIAFSLALLAAMTSLLYAVRFQLDKS